MVLRNVILQRVTVVKISTDLSTSSSLSDGNRGLHTKWPVSLFPTGALNTSGPVQNGNYYSLCCLLSLFQVLLILSFHFYIPLLPPPSRPPVPSRPVAFPGWQWWIACWVRWSVMPYPTPEYTLSHLPSPLFPFFFWVSSHPKVSEIQWG